MKKLNLRLGTRSSALARTQSQWVADQLERLWSDTKLQVELIFIKTTGDIQKDVPLGSLGLGKGIFTREIEVALLEGQVDFAVHSLKDLPTTLPPGLQLGCVPPREDPRDALVGPGSLESLAPGAVVGTGSARRQSQLRSVRPDLRFEDIRGNVPTRVEKWRNGPFGGGVVLAIAGLNRLGVLSGAAPEEIHPLSVSHCVPAPCQGILGIECRAKDQETLEILARLNHGPAALSAQLERSFLAQLGGSCNLPAGCLAQPQQGELLVRAFLEQNGQSCHQELRLAISEDFQEAMSQAQQCGRDLASQLMEQSGGV